MQVVGCTLHEWPYTLLQNRDNSGLLGTLIPVNRPYLGGTVPLLLPLSHFYPLLSHFRKSTSISHKVAKKDDSEKREYKLLVSTCGNSTACLATKQLGSLLLPPPPPPLLHQSWTCGGSMLNTKHLEPPSLR